MKYSISKINRTVELDDNLVREFSKYDNLRDSIFTITLRSKYKTGVSVSDVSDDELSAVCNKILLSELQAIADLPSAVQTYTDNLAPFKTASDKNQCIEKRIK